MDIDHLHLFLEVAQYGSFKQVADRHFLSQRAVSKQIRQLESELGVTLFQRKANTITLNTQGHFFWAEAQDIVNHYNNAVHELHGLDHLSSQTLRIGYFSIFESHLLQADVHQLKADHPDVHVTIREASNEHLVKSIHRGALDIAYSIEYGQSVLPETSSLTVLPIFSGEMVLGLSADNPLAEQQKIKVTDLQEIPILYYSPESSTFLLESFLASIPQSQQTKHVQRVPSIEQMQLLVALNQAVAFYPAGLLDTGSASTDNIVYRPFELDSQEYRIVMVYDPQNSNPALHHLLQQKRATITDA
ncbi:LysR family transcriptional regulator [Levilactobacillus cerevisiae]|uniref:LysR family transcriptional regulator n=1 Tax=Levilactobacillus cerevisiae TaxID=1704076 RepID=UPI000F7B3304|nr:LysR family transcriptional regulator [Levilactobacillus cerevisiae]